MNRMDAGRRAAVVKALAEGMSIRATVRMTGAAKATVTKLLVEIGAACAHYQDMNFRNLATNRVEADEIWAFVGAKERNVPKELRGQGRGDVWTWTALDADSKLIFSWHVGQRDKDACVAFVDDMHFRLANRVQLSTDGHAAYRQAVEQIFGWNGVDYGMVVKQYAVANRENNSPRYSPSICIGAEKHGIMGNPDPKLISTSFVERQNLTMRMQMRRFTRLTNAFSKKVENHAAAVALHFMYYNFVKPHGTLTKAAKGVHTTPAMVAGITDHVWTAEEIVKLVSSKELTAKEIAARPN